MGCQVLCLAKLWSFACTPVYAGGMFAHEGVRTGSEHILCGSPSAWEFEFHAERFVALRARPFGLRCI